MEHVQQSQKVETIAEAMNNAQTVEDCIRLSEYFIKVAFSFMKKAETIKMGELKQAPPENLE